MAIAGRLHTPVRGVSAAAGAAPVLEVAAAPVHQATAVHPIARMGEVGISSALRPGGGGPHALEVRSAYGGGGQTPSAACLVGERGKSL